MIQLKICIQNQQGIHIRPATEIVKQLKQFQSKIIVMYDGKEENIKNIVNLVSLRLDSGSYCILKCSGEDELEASVVAKEILEKEYSY